MLPPSAAMFSKEESDLCSEQRCLHFIAPCRLSHTEIKKTESLMEEKYLSEAENYRQHNYCLRPPRPLAGMNYSNRTCLFLFVKQLKCDQIYGFSGGSSANNASTSASLKRFTLGL